MILQAAYRFEELKAKVPVGRSVDDVSGAFANHLASGDALSGHKAPIWRASSSTSARRTSGGMSNPLT
jgi:hypothetical protein